MIPTRGDLDLDLIVSKMPFDEVIVYDNSVREDMGLYARYAAIAEAKHDVIATQDDDLHVHDWRPLLDLYEPGRVAVNAREHWRSEPWLAWVGCGAVFDRGLPFEAFARLNGHVDEHFRAATCDAYFGVLTPFRRVLGNVTDLPVGFAPGRIASTPGWGEVRSAAVERALTLRSEVLLNLGCGDKVLDGFTNLDKRNGWRFEDGLGTIPDCSVAGITVSHSLMYLPLERWPALFAECARVLRGGGVLRVTEDSTGDVRSERFGGHVDAVTLTTPALVLENMEAAGLSSERVSATETSFPDGRLLQDWHGGEPKVFFVEGVMP